MAEGEPRSEGGGETPDDVTSREDGDPTTPSNDIADQFEIVERLAGVTKKKLAKVRASRSKFAHGPHNETSEYDWSK